MKIRKEITPFIVIVWAIGALTTLPLLPLTSAPLAPMAVLCVLLTAVLLHFFRDPERTPPPDADAVVAGADGVILDVREEEEDNFLNTRITRVSIFLRLWDVHVTRSPIAGTVRELGYVPGKAVPAFNKDSSTVNRRSTILVEGDRTSCLVEQIVGLIARRAVHWPRKGQSVDRGERIGMMKFGSRLDASFPCGDVDVRVEKGQRMRAGETIIARLKESSR